MDARPRSSWAGEYQRSVPNPHTGDRSRVYLDVGDGLIRNIGARSTPRFS
jgi:hypothetical protein